MTVLAFCNDCLRRCLLFFALLIFTSINQTTAQCPDGDLKFSIQEQIDDFAKKYPDCTEIRGDLFISGLNIQNLSGLGQIRGIHGELSIGYIPNLRSLNGLSRLSNIGGNLQIFNLDRLPNLDGLAKLKTIGGDFLVSTNSILNNLDSLSNLNTINGELLIYNNPLLSNLDGLSALKFIQGDIYIAKNNLINSVKFPSMATINGQLHIDK